MVLSTPTTPRASAPFTARCPVGPECLAWLSPCPQHLLPQKPGTPCLTLPLAGPTSAYGPTQGPASPSASRQSLHSLQPRLLFRGAERLLQRPHPPGPQPAPDPQSQLRVGRHRLEFHQPLLGL